MPNRTANLILITSYFPQKKKENFLNQELPIVAKSYSKVYLFPLNEVTDSVALPVNVEVRPDLFSTAGLPSYKSYLAKNFCKVLFSCIRDKRLSKSGIIQFCKMGILSMKMKEFLRSEKIAEKESVGYSYWLDEGSVILSLVKDSVPNLKIISRAHGYDLYEEDYPQGLPPFYSYATKRLDKIYLISKNGKEYFDKRNPGLANKTELSYLGTQTFGPLPIDDGDNKTLKIVSCSSIIPLKRLSLLAKALRDINLEVEWHHFGDGPLRTEVETMIKNSKNCKAFFHGHISNDDLLKHYSKVKYDLFVNVSTTEGLPVSLIEAASYGTPLLATNVRGTNEICNDITGVLVPAQISEKELRDKIEGALKREWSRESIVAFWEEKFNGQNNFELFREQLKSI